MKCPNCGKELEEGKLLCGECGEEIKIVPVYDIELENRLSESISSMIEDIAVPEQDRKAVFHDDIKAELRNLRRIKKAAMIFIIILAAAGMTAAVHYQVDSYRYNSYEYQYDRAVECAENNDYPEAVSYLERALAIHPEDLDAKFLLAEYYDKDGKQQSTMSLLEELLDAGTGYAGRDEVYDMLIGIYESRADYVKIDDLLKNCDIPRIVTKYNRYTALEPEFDKQGGEYDEPVSVSLSGKTQGSVYYTLDGTVPTGSSDVYRTPILLESGDYTVRAVFINIYGIESDIVTRQYHISLPEPDKLVINPESGAYTGPVLIEAYHDNNTKVYYTTDGSVPDRNSERYRNPIEMPYGSSSFSFVSVDESGLRSEVVSRSYQLEIQANFDTELAVQVLKNSLWAGGKLLDVEGNVPNRPGMNQYRVQTLYKEEETVYYIVHELYVDAVEKVHDTHNFYAIDVNTADLYKAYKVDEGKYTLRPFAE